MSNPGVMLKSGQVRCRFFNLTIKNFKETHVFEYLILTLSGDLRSDFNIDYVFNASTCRHKLTGYIQDNRHCVMTSVVLPEHQNFPLFRFLVVNQRNKYMVSAVFYIRWIHFVELFSIKHDWIRWFGKINNV